MSSGNWLFSTFNLAKVQLGISQNARIGVLPGRELDLGGKMSQMTATHETSDSVQQAALGS